MSSTLQQVDEPADAELISAVRAGDVDAYGLLFERHVEAARRLARQLVSAGDADDLVSEAFTKVLVVLQRGGGPDLAFRAYLLTAVRRLHVDRIRTNARLHTTDDLTPFDPGVPFRDTAVEGFENAAAARAFASLPERWQMVLWHTEVEGQRPAEVAPLLGMTANSVSALAYRAREGLRQAFLAMHAQDVDDDVCTWTHRNLGAYVRNGLSRRDSVRVEDHLSSCRSCAAIYLELTEVNANLAGLLAPALLGGAAAAYVAAGSSAALKGGVPLLVDRARDLVAGNLPATAVAGVAVGAVVSGAVLWNLGQDPPSPTGPSDTVAASPVAPSAPEQATASKRPDRRDQDRPAPPAASGTAAAPSPAPVQAAGPDGTAPTEPGESRQTPPPDDQSPPSDDPPPPSGDDVRVSARARADGAGRHTVTVQVGGLGPGHSGRLQITGEGTAAVLTTDDRCDVLGVGSGTCSFGSTPTTFVFTALAPAGDASLVFTVHGPGTDPDPSDNQARVRLGG